MCSLSAAWLLRISSGAIATQVALTLTTWILLAAGPREPNWNGPPGATCPDLSGLYSGVLDAIAFSSLAVGAVAVSSSILSVHRRVSRGERILVGLGASALSFAIFFLLFSAAFCGFN